MVDVPYERKFFTELESELKRLGVPSERATAWARAQVEHARKRERRGHSFAFLAICGGDAATRIANLDAAGHAPRAWQ